MKRTHSLLIAVLMAVSCSCRAQAQSIQSTTIGSGVSGFGTTSTDGVVLTNGNPAAVNAQQQSPSLAFYSQGWGTTPSASTNLAFWIDALPVQGAAVPTQTMEWQSKIGGAAATKPMTLTSSGVLTLLGNVSATSFTAAAGNQFTLTSGFSIASGGANGTIQPTTSSGSFIATIQWSTTNTTKTANYSVAAIDGGIEFNNAGAGGAVTNTLPTSRSGLQFSFYVDAAQILCVQAAGSDTIRDVGTVSAAAGNVFSSTVGSTLHLFCPVAGKWIIDQERGTWTGPQ